MNVEISEKALEDAIELALVSPELSCGKSDWRTGKLTNARLIFDNVVSERVQDMVDTNFQFYKRITDDREFANYFLDWLFDRYREGIRGQESQQRASN